MLATDGTTLLMREETVLTMEAVLVDETSRELEGRSEEVDDTTEDDVGIEETILELGTALATLLRGDDRRVSFLPSREAGMEARPYLMTRGEGSKMSFWAPLG